MSCKTCTCTECKEGRSKKAQKAKLEAVNTALWQAGNVYYSTMGAALDKVDLALAAHGFDCETIDKFFRQDERHYRLHEQCGVNVWLTVSLYRMDSGNWELVSYVN